MKAITLWQPYASLIVTGAKKIETRGWETKYRGTLAIHAAMTDNRDLRSLMSGWEIQTGFAPLKGLPITLQKLTWSGVKWEDLPRGVIIATCKLVDCIPIEKLTLEQVESEKHFGDFSLGRFGWILEDVEPLEKPIPAKGMQRIWNWDNLENKKEQTP